MSPLGRTPRVALVYVGAPESVDVPVMTAPIGVQALASLLDSRGVPVELLDTRLVAPADLAARLDRFDPDVVGLSFLSPVAETAVALARSWRRPGRLLLAGGPHASIHSDDLLASEAFDVVVRKEGELALLDVVARVEAGEPVPAVIDGRSLLDLDVVPPFAPFPVYSSVYSGETFRSVYVQLGRGCPMSCTFCELPNRVVFDPPRRRHRTLDAVMREVETYVERWDVNFVSLVDSIATLNLDLLTGFVEAMDSRYPHVGFMLNSHVRRFPHSIAETLGRAQQGRRPEQRITVWFGFESGSQRLLDFMDKRTTVAQGIETAQLCHEHDIQLGANLLLGLPDETAADHADHVAFMDAIDATFPNPNVLNPLPGTRMHDWCVERRRLRDATDVSIWKASDIARRGHGPVLGVDYEQVLRTYYRYAPDAPPAAHEFRHRPWADALVNT